MLPPFLRVSLALPRIVECSTYLSTGRSTRQSGTPFLSNGPCFQNVNQFKRKAEIYQSSLFFDFLGMSSPLIEALFFSPSFSRDQTTFSLQKAATLFTVTTLGMELAASYVDPPTFPPFPFCYLPIATAPTSRPISAPDRFANPRTRLILFFRRRAALSPS